MASGNACMRQLCLYFFSFALSKNNRHIAKALPLLSFFFLIERFQFYRRLHSQEQTMPPSLTFEISCEKTKNKKKNNNDNNDDNDKDKMYSVVSSRASFPFIRGTFSYKGVISPVHGRTWG